MVIQPKHMVAVATLAIIGLSGGHAPTAAQAQQTTTADASSNTKSSSGLLDGSAATLQDVVTHYRVRALGLTSEQQADLVEYLKSL